MSFKSPDETELENFLKQINKHVKDKNNLNIITEKNSKLGKAIKKIIEIAEYPAIFILRIKNSAGERVIRDAPSGRSLVPNRSINSEAYSKTKPKIANAISP